MEDIKTILEDETKRVEQPKKEIYRAVYRRRGSDLIIATTDDQLVQVSRFSHRAKVSKHYVHDAAYIDSHVETIKKLLIEEKYKLAFKGKPEDQPAAPIE